MAWTEGRQAFIASGSRTDRRARSAAPPASADLPVPRRAASSPGRHDPPPQL